MSAIHIGISGWRYAPWRGDFYPEGLAQKHELHHAVEIRHASFEEPAFVELLERLGLAERLEYRPGVLP